MKKLFVAMALFLSSQLAFTCDEACKRTNAEATHKIKFASYLNANYCRSLAIDMLLKDKKGLTSYRDNQLPTAHRGGAKNIRTFITQRRDWLLECDQYLELTEQGRIFRDKDTSIAILEAMKRTSDELEKIMRRTQNDAEVIDVVIAPAKSQFDNLFKLIDAHYLELQRRGQL
jgi:hypothetical protein